MRLTGHARISMAVAGLCLALWGCGGGGNAVQQGNPPSAASQAEQASEAEGQSALPTEEDLERVDAKPEPDELGQEQPDDASVEGIPTEEDPDGAARPDELRANLDLHEDYRASFVHGDKDTEHQRYIVLHDTESEADAASVIDWWDESGRGVAAHFVVDRDGSVWQCVPLDKIAHHAGYGDTGHNELYGIVEDGRDDMVGSSPIGDWASDYAMNAWSIGIELSHNGEGGEDYPAAQLEALDGLIAYIDASYGFESTIIDHKAWRSGNSDTSVEFAGYLANYRDHRTHG